MVALVRILCSFVDCTGEEGHDSFESEEDGRDGFACGILGLLWARYEFEERCGVGAKVRSLEISVNDQGSERYPWADDWRTPGGHLADTWEGPGGVTREKSG